MAFSLLRRAAAAVLCVALLAGCGAQPQQEEPASSVPQEVQQPAELSALTLGYVPSEGFNPYVANSILVAQNAGLLFEKLVEITPDMDLEYRLAQSIESTGETVLIHPRGGCVFADGTPITAEDILASLLAAKNSAMYGGRFANVAEAVVREGAVVLTLLQPDSLFDYLCDIPVVKAAEAASPQPTPSGRYTYGSGETLVRNTRAPFPEDGPEEIRLAEVAGYDAMTSGLSVGTLNLYAAADEAEAVPSIVSQENFYKTNRMVYLGINAERDYCPMLAQPQGRALLSRLLSRRQLADKSFYGRAYPATGVINGFYPCVDSGQVILAEQDAQGADAAFAALGYTMDPMTGFYQDGEGGRLSLELLVYSGNTYKRYAAALIKEQLAAQGIEVHLVAVDDFETYRQLVQAKEFDLYIGEVKLYNNMDISPFLMDGALSAGLAQTEGVALSYQAFRANKSAAAAFEQAFAADMPFAPLVWRSGTVVSSRSVSGVVSSVSNVFYSLQDLAVGRADSTDQ